MKSAATVMKRNEEVKGLKIVNTDSLFDRMKGLYDKVAKRAYELFDKRGREFGKDFDDWFHAEFEILRPLPIELKETKDMLMINAEVPGFTADELEVSIDPKRIMITGKTEHTNKRKEATTVFTELRSNEIFRICDLPVAVDPEKVKATLKNGLLELTLPKTRETKSVTVDVKG